MPTSDPQAPRRMPWEDFARRALHLAKDVLDKRGRAPALDGPLREEAEALFGYEAERVLAALSHPPRICPVCNGLHHRTLGDICHACEEKQAESAWADREAAIRADERAKVRGELAQKDEA